MKACAAMMTRKPVAYLEHDLQFNLGQDRHPDGLEVKT